MYNTIFSTGLRWLWITPIVLLLDLGTKHWIMTCFWLGESIRFIPYINITYTYNLGSAFSFLANGGGWQCWVFSAIAILTTSILLIIMYYSSHQSRLSNIAYAMIIGGALGNLWNRMAYGVVIDFIDFYIGNWHWPTFNLADTSICIGTLLISLKERHYSAFQSLKK
ncbi:lipoprotein signal peptidase [secondary endosymbiont of Heteropsylla cubana]|uniref:Lipoprotein signal peptidase n=1 Tax=secondary endosymbiont of Heteropsylla cubana TaxID=134287 RepID=J3TZ68_9ENTR|nr:signal peptidase II [secondary endosymbiont of Heteropsylla cubana]AFP85770.1 lipoprotein signal peptidase [secondary endosymbiont of Heteropsylla cubana]